MENALFPCFFGGLTTIMRSVLTGIGVPALLDKVAPVSGALEGDPTAGV